MKRVLLGILFSILPFVAISQDYSDQWEGHFSYFNIIDIEQGNDIVFAASENAVFTYDLLSGDIDTISTINGLSGENISTIHYSNSYGLLLIGYENGLIEIVSDSSDDILTVIDILDKPSIPPTSKRINHFNEFNELVYISTDFGISEYNLNNLEFGDTFFIGDGGSHIQVSETTIFGDFIYAATLGGNGLKKALYSSNNLIDFQEWQTALNGSFLHVNTSDAKLYTIRGNNRIYEVINDTLIELFIYPSQVQDFKIENNKLSVTLNDKVYLYDSNFVLLLELDPDPEYESDFTTSLFSSDDSLYIGTKEFGLLRTTEANPLDKLEIHPDGPLLNTPFSLEANDDDLWVTFGDYTIFYNPSPVRQRGVSHLMEEEWINISYDSLFGARNLNKITINPNDSNEVFISSFQSGLLEIYGNSPINLYNTTNSGLESIILSNNPNFLSIRVSGSNFDSEGLLWSISSLIDRPLKSFDPETNQWQSYSFSDIIGDPLSSQGFKDLVIDNNRTKWIGSFIGLIGVKTDSGTPVLKNLKGDDANMPSDDIRAIKLDNRNQLWIGTSQGLRVLFNPESLFTEEDVQAREIIIIDDGIPRELLFQQWISDIEVDGSNNKWIGTLTTGLFYFSENGQETIFHFTTDNSPLPSNNIIDVSIESTNGKVYIATDKGLVAFNSGGSKPKNSLSEAFVYPNPVRPTFNISEERVKIKDISENVNIKITDIEGNLVAEAQSNVNSRYKGFNLEIDGGTAFWNGRNLANNVVKSGVYLVLLSDLDTLETKVLKLMVIR